MSRTSRSARSALPRGTGRRSRAGRGSRWCASGIRPRGNLQAPRLLGAPRRSHRCPPAPAPRPASSRPVRSRPRSRQPQRSPSSLMPQARWSIVLLRDDGGSCHDRGVANRLMLLDTASLYFRAFYGVPDSLKAPNGTPVNAVRGLLDMIARLITEFEPTHRVAQVVPGGVDVEEAPDPLEVQVPLIREVLALLGIARVGAPQHEADDVIGTLATGAGMPVDVVTGDRDLFQLVDDEASVRVLYIARGVGNHERVTRDWVRAKY